MWDDIARQYWLWCINNRWYYHRLGMEIWKVVGKPKCILDVGSGPGIFAEELKKLFSTSNIVCLDSSMEMCRLARGIRGEASFLPFKSECFDLVIFCFSLHELEIQSALEEAKRVLKRDGWILVVDFNKDAPEIVKKTFKFILGKIISLEYANHLEKSWNNFENCKKLLKRFEEMNFETIWREGIHDVFILAKKI